MPGPGGPGPRGPRGPKPKIKNPGKVLGRLLKIVVKKYPIRCILVVICIVGAALVNMRGNLFLQELIDDYVTPLIGQSSPDFAPLAAAILKLGCIYVCGILMQYLQTRLMVVVAQGTLLNLRRKLFSRMETLPLRYFDTHAHGDIMSIYTNDCDTLRQLISQSIPQVISSVITLVSVFCSMLYLSIPLTAVSVAMVAVMLVITGKVGGLSSRFFVEQQRNLGRVNGYIEEMMEGQKVVKVFCHEDINRKDFKKINDELYGSAYSAQKFASILGPINNNLGYFSYVFVAVVGGALAIFGRGSVMSLSVGALVSFLTFNKSFNMPISQISMQINSVVMGLAGAVRIFDLLDQEPEKDEGYVTLTCAKEAPDGSLTECAERTGIWAWKHYHSADNTTTYERLKGAVEFEHVEFGYVPEKIVLHDVNINAMPGQKIAFVGSTGAGKTTITNLINRFYDIQAGKIRYDGINIGKIKKDDLRHSLGIVLQDTHLFTGTVMENIRFGKLDATDEEVKAAARLANADLFIRHLPQGYDTVLTGDGANLSQGQRQLLSIARAAVADPPVLILDEATSSIDTRTERIVQEGMDKLMHGRTTFVIAHRLSTVRNADCIIVLEKGNIIERGTHDELIAKKGRYYQLYTGHPAQT